MKRAGKQEQGRQPPPDRQPHHVHIIEPYAVYYREDLPRLLRMKDSGVLREIRSRRLRVSKRCGRYRILGKWLIEWIELGELAPRKAAGVHSPLAANGRDE
jgi:hypothetical protein